MILVVFTLDNSVPVTGPCTLTGGGQDLTVNQLTGTATNLNYISTMQAVVDVHNDGLLDNQISMLGPTGGSGDCVIVLLPIADELYNQIVTNATGPTVETRRITSAGQQKARRSRVVPVPRPPSRAASLPRKQI